MTPHPPDPPSAPDPLAVALSKLDPAPHGFQWNALMFAAGRASKARALRFWQATTALCALAAVALAAVLFARPAAPPAERVIYVERPAALKVEPTPEPLPLPLPEPSVGPGEELPPNLGSAARWLIRRNEVLAAGFDGPPAPGAPAPPPAREE